MDTVAARVYLYTGALYGNSQVEPGPAEQALEGSSHGHEGHHVEGQVQDAAVKQHAGEHAVDLPGPQGRTGLPRYHQYTVVPSQASSRAQDLSWFRGLSFMCRLKHLRGLSSDNPPALLNTGTLCATNPGNERYSRVHWYTSGNECQIRARW